MAGIGPDGRTEGGRIPKDPLTPEERETLLARLQEYFAGQPDVVVAYLFGSAAKGRMRRGSDVDVAVLLRGVDDAEKRFDRRLALIGGVENICQRDADVVVLNDAQPLLQNQVLRYGRLFFERDRVARVDFEVRVGKVYADLKPMYDFHTRDLFQKIKEVGLSGRRRRHHPRETETAS